MLPIHCAKKPYEKLADGTIQEVEVPYEIPESWNWVKLRNIGSITSGGTPKSSEPSYYGGNITWITPADMGKQQNNKFFAKSSKKITELGLQKSSAQLISKNSIVYSSRAPIGHINIVTEDYTTNQGCKSITPLLVDLIFLYWLLQFRTKDIILRSSGTTFKEISASGFGDTLLPLPPLAEQKRIVAQIEKALAKVDEYAESYNKLQQLDKEFPDKLKKSILQYAMQGKLVAQSPDDEPVEVLLEKIQAEKQKLYEEGKLKKKDLAEIVVTKGDDNSPYKEVPYSIPRSWKWVRLNDITSYIQRGKSPKYSTIPKYPVIAQKCNQWSGFSIELAKFVSPDTVDSYQEERLLKDGDLMWNSTGLGTLGRLAIYSEVKNPYGWAVADSHVTIIRLLLKFIDYHFIYHFLASPIVQNVIEEQASGSTKQKELATTTVKNYLIPLPPLTEQQRIVSKISQVFSVIESLV
ncbi:Type-1 restriction enzyme EcoKI specificity protein [Streptococcus infantarius subsp. infantarius]|nr:Type-1 restriction enzyme EcoKI specificity protein [Streptococcus infantarius subsp. infantarius]